MRFIIPSLVVVSVFTAGTQVHADPAPAMDLLKQASAASAKLTTISYDGTAFGEGDLSKVLPKVTGKVIAERGPNEQEHKLAIHGEIIASGAKPARFSFVSDGKQAFRIDHEQKSYLSGAYREARVMETGALLPAQYFNENPFAQELSAVSAQVEPPQKVDNIECDVLKIQYDNAGQHEARIFLGKKDHLLRRVDRFITAPLNGVMGKQQVVYLFNALEPGVKVDSKTFVLDCPPGYSKKTFAQLAEEIAKANAPAAPGGPCPDWTLKTADGKQVSLKSLRGRPIMLDFWATWCGPCKMAMPGVQKIYDHFKGKPVDIFGANCWERGSSDGAVKYIKDKGYTYPQLLGADELATKLGIHGIPTFVVIGPDGKILHMASGYDPAGEQKIISIIENSMKK